MVMLVILTKLLKNVYRCVQHQLRHHTLKFKIQGLNCPLNQELCSKSPARNKNKHKNEETPICFGAVPFICFTDFDPFMLHSGILKPRGDTDSIFSFLGSLQKSVGSQ